MSEASCAVGSPELFDCHLNAFKSHEHLHFVGATQNTTTTDSLPIWEFSFSSNKTITRVEISLFSICAKRRKLTNYCRFEGATDFQIISLCTFVATVQTVQIVYEQVKKKNIVWKENEKSSRTVGSPLITQVWLSATRSKRILNHYIIQNTWWSFNSQPSQCCCWGSYDRCCRRSIRSRRRPRRRRRRCCFNRFALAWEANAERKNEKNNRSVVALRKALSRSRTVALVVCSQHECMQ